MSFINLILRGLQFLWALLTIALIGNVIDNNRTGSESAINYAMFSVIIAWLALLLGLAGAFVSAFSEGIFGWAALALDAAATLFTLIAGIVLAAKLHSVSCGGDLTSHSSSWIGFGSSNDEKRCRELQASTAFLWFLSACLAGSLVMTFLNHRRGGTSSVSTGPHMSQVGV